MAKLTGGAAPPAQDGAGHRCTVRDMTRIASKWARPLLAGPMLLVAAMVAGCPTPMEPGAGEPPPPPATAEPGPTSDDYPTLCAHEQRRETVKQYLEAWRDREAEGEQFEAARAELLKLYAQAAAVLEAGPTEDPEPLRIMWDLAGLAHATMLSPAAILEEADLTGQDGSGPPTIATDPSLQQLPEPPTDVPARFWELLEAVTVEPDGTRTFADFVRDTARSIYLTVDLPDWSPVCPLNVCGSSEPVTRTLILLPAKYIDFQRKAAWEMAAVAVHEAAHMEWFHRQEVSEDPRLLLPLPNERNSWRIMACFTEGLLAIDDPALKAHVSEHEAEIRQRLEDALASVAIANETLGLPEDDRSEVVEIPEGVELAELRRTPVARSAAGPEETGPGTP
ncbi:MAG: hypothetical protein U9R79_10075 [Armatimonadota bacterium]|nr:hypothetical protein [Armatimonadota bacterium]